MLAQPRQRPLVQEPGEIIRAVGQQFAAAEPDEEIEELALGRVRVGAARRLRERRMREPERARVAAQGRQARQQRGIGRAREQRDEQRVFLRARGIDFVDSHRPCRLLGIEIGPQRSRDHPGRGLDRQDALCGNMRPV